MPRAALATWPSVGRFIEADLNKAWVPVGTVAAGFNTGA
jgi:hypothetical protein